MTMAATIGSAVRLVHENSVRPRMTTPLGSCVETTESALWPNHASQYRKEWVFAGGW